MDSKPETEGWRQFYIRRSTLLRGVHLCCTFFRRSEKVQRLSIFSWSQTVFFLHRSVKKNPVLVRNLTVYYHPFYIGSCKSRHLWNLLAVATTTPTCPVRLIFWLNAWDRGNTRFSLGEFSRRLKAFYFSFLLFRRLQ